MKYFKITCLLIAMFFLNISLGISQSKRPAMSFNKTTHDFGTVKEKGGSVSTKFMFTNTGKQPVIIGKVNAACGCTTPDWSNKPIKPGEKGYVEAKFNPKNRPGRFNKSVTVYSNSTESPVVLRIKGEVKAAPKSLDEVYKHKMGAIRLKTNHAAFTKVLHDQKETERIGIVNISDEPVNIDFARVPKHISVKAEPTTLESREKGKLTLTYDARQKNAWGYVRDALYIKINNNFDYNNRLHVSASIRENFSDLTEKERENAPVLSFKNKTFNFGTISQGKKVTHEYEFTNEGKRDLKIRKVKASCGCTATNAGQKVIKAGESSTIKATFNSANKSGKQRKAVTVYANDPENPKKVLWIKGKVK